MYTIEYYNTQKEKPLIDESIPSIESRNITQRINRRRMHQQELRDVVSNIKSITIDLEDLNRVMLDRRLIHLNSLFSRIRRNGEWEKHEAITIPNNSLNQLCIYEIIKCDWMVNSEADFDYSDILDKLSQLTKLNNKSKTKDEDNSKTSDQNKKELLRYYIDTILRKYNENKEKEFINSKTNR